MNDLQDKVILVTGGGAGIGEAIVRAVAAQGAKVAILDVDVEAAENLAAQIGGAKAYEADVASFEMMERVCDQIVEDFGALHGAVNNAGIGGEIGPAVDCTPQNWDLVIQVNLTGVFYSVRAELKHMLANGGGAIVNMASLGGILAERNLLAYVAAKHGVVGLTKSVTVDHARQGIRCNAICPAFIRTPMTEHLFHDADFVEMIQSHQPNGRILTADEVAEIAVFLLSDRSSAMTGSVHLADGGLATI